MFRVSKLLTSSLQSVPVVNRWSSSSFQVNGAAIHAKSEMKRLYTLHKLMKRMWSVKFVVALSLRIASFVCAAIAKRLKRMESPR